MAVSITEKVAARLADSVHALSDEDKRFGYTRNGVCAVLLPAHQSCVCHAAINEGPEHCLDCSGHNRCNIEMELNDSFSMLGVDADDCGYEDR